MMQQQRATVLLLLLEACAGVAAEPPAAYAAAAEAGSCSTDLDCHLAGTCTAGKCECKPWWTGARCTQLNFAPAASVTQGIHQEGVSTWGGSVIKSEADGLYHAHAAEFLSHCGVSAWTHNSQSVHFTAEEPLGPFTRKDVTQSRFSHNPSATVLPDGSWLLFHLGLGTPRRNKAQGVEPVYTNCSGGRTLGVPTEWTSACDSHGCTGSFDGDGDTQVLRSEAGPAGPWVVHNITTTTATGAATFGINDNGAPLAPHLLNDSSIKEFSVMFAARNRYDGCHKMDCSELGIARAKSWKGPYVLDPLPVCSGPLCKNGTIPDWRVYCEDPYYWRDEDGSWHALCNSKDCPSRPPEPPDPTPSYPYFCNGNGMHAYSRTGAAGDWHWQTSEAAYTNAVTMTNGSTVHIGRRERPHLLFGNGRPTHLFTAVTWTSDRSWTFGQALKTDDGDLNFVTRTGITYVNLSQNGLHQRSKLKTDDGDLSFSAGFSSHMVLQRAPAKAAVYGFGAGPVTVKVAGADSTGLEAVSYSVVAHAAAKADDGGGGVSTWKAYLKPMKAGGSYTITATGSAGSATLEHVTMGDVFFCSGQSNMALSTHYTFSADTVRAAFTADQYKGLRLFQFGGMSMNTTLASYSPRYVTASQSVATDPLHGSWYTAEQSTSVVMSKTSDFNMTAFDTFSATCLYFGLELIDALGDRAPPIGLIQSAVGGSTIEAWQANETRAECTDRMVPHAGMGGGKGGFPFMQHQPGALYYGYVTPFVNMSIFGYLWYQGENNCGMRNVGNSAAGTGYSCEISKMVAAWREVWSTVPGTTDPRAPFGIATLASGGSEGNGAHMANMRAAQTASYGHWDNEALPNTFGAQLYDLGDPWGHAGTGDGNELTAAGNETRCCAEYQNCQHPSGNWTCTAAQNASNAACEARGQTGKACGDANYCANVDPATGKYGPKCAAWNSSKWWGTLKQQEPLVRKNAPSGIPALNFMGGIHPRLKRPVGRRLAAAIVNLVPDYREIKQGNVTAGTGPTLSGCTRDSSSLALHFNRSLLGSEQLLLRPFEADMRNWAWRYDSGHKRLNKTDSAGLMVCTASADPEVPGNATTCACSTWEMLELNGTQIRYCGQGPGWKPSPELIKAGKPGKDQSNPFATQWMALPLRKEDDQQEESATVSVSVDLAPLGGREPLAVRLAWPMFATRVGSADDMCCVHAATQSDTSHAPGNAAGGPVGGIAPCVPGNCPLYSSVSELPANPFFAVISGGKCACQKPQVCDETVRPAAIKTDDAALSLRFSACGSKPETWSVHPQRSDMLTLQSKLGGCITSRGSSALATVPCSASDEAQLWTNGTTKNVLPKGQTGFLHTANATASCTDKNGACCLTNNGAAGAALYGCCPSGPSDCGNQVIRLHKDGTLRDARHPSDCLQHAAAPPPPPPPPARTADTFEKLGMMDYESYESTPLVFNKKKLLMETIALVYPGHALGPSCSSYFRIRDLESGEVLHNLEKSCNHSFGSAFVDTHANGTETLWVVGTSWWRPAFKDIARSGLLESRLTEGWGGSCKSGANCTIASFHTTDASLQEWESGVALSPGRSSWNCDITTGRPQEDGSKTYVMAVEQQPLQGAPAGSGWTSYFYVKDEPKSDPAYGNLNTGWRLLPTETHVIGGPGTHGACPTIRFIPDAQGGMYYVISGGLSVYLDRSRDLATWQPSKDKGIVLQTSINDTKVCSKYIHYKPRASEQALLATAKVAFSSGGCAWDCDASDVDLWEMGDGTVLFYFLSGNQGNHIFAALGQFRGTMAQWFVGQYDETDTSSAP